MQLLNIVAPKGIWTQVYDGTADATVAISGSEAQICQSTAKPDLSLVGLPFIGGSLNLSLYHVTAGAPVFVKPLNADATIIVNA
ncbi:hypothetical protein [Edwardsiella phage GF-2]|uniref:Uncharacterized protein n=1 Tax=Edwardsiella phage GF-2 TaxID=1537091 RepID=A0A077KC69_9CAUD|nr:hypothetical protein VC56_gp81 [Edwardsiella phage GF-2]BAP28952.1 hypothetical protein [Edwardsiella phage GF-2]BEH73329.1 hypothetical protein GBS0709_24460 [Edwardsiella tarda]